MSRHQPKNKTALTIHLILSTAQAATSLLSKFLPNPALISLTLTISTLTSAIILSKTWEKNEEVV